MMAAAASPKPDAGLRAIGSLRHFAAHQTIFTEGEDAVNFMLVIHGMVRSCSSFSDGRRFIGAFYTKGDVFGLERHSTYLTSAEAVCESAIVLYPATGSFSPLHAEHSLSQQIMGALMSSGEQAHGHARLLGRLTAIEKISAFLLQRHERSPDDQHITLEMTRQDIADYLGLTVETISRCLGQLKRGGVISFRSPRQLDLLNVKALRTLSG